MENKKIKLGIAATIVFVTVMIVCIFLIDVGHSAEDQVNITNTTCTVSELLGRRVFFHVCSKADSTVYDVRHFWKDDHKMLKASVFGVQMSSEEFSKICTYCLNSFNV